MAKIYHRSRVGVSNLKPCVACNAMIAENATRCRHCQAEQKPWRRTTTWAVPVLSLVVAIAALMPEVISAVSSQFTRSYAAVRLITAANVENTLVLTFDNAGTERALLSKSATCTVESEVDPAVQIDFRNDQEEIIAPGNSAEVHFDGLIGVRRGEASRSMAALSILHAGLVRELGPKAVPGDQGPQDAFQLRCLLRVTTMPFGTTAQTASDVLRSDPGDAVTEDVAFDLILHSRGQADALMTAARP